MRLGDDVDLDAIASASQAFQLADLSAVCSEAGLICIKEHVMREEEEEIDDDGDVVVTESDVNSFLVGKKGHVDAVDADANAAFADVRIMQAHFVAAIEKVVPSTFREHALVSRVFFSDGSVPRCDRYISC
jgi:SpoVK/Ycf46/Vps4 family AAA+-type ATPase